MKEKFYVTTPIYYVTAAPHLGSLYSTVLADVFARYHTLLGNDIFFLTGTDEHGQKIAQAAQNANKKPKEFVDGFIDSYKNIWKLYNINYSKFIRTTDDYHVKGVQIWLEKLIEKGDVYKDIYKGFYCTPCETFITDTNLKNETSCPSCQRETIQINEECYFFKLSSYQEKLLEFYNQNPEFITPKERANEVISFIKEGLKDLSISRKTVTWGIPFPGDNQHVTYVWADALNNYITAIGYGDKNKEKEFKKWWPADLQILGKDILRFHAIYWPAFLMASDLPLPKKLLVHGWLTVNGQKMSKSLGNTIEPEHLAKKYGVDQIRYYLSRKMAITQDSDFNTKDIEQSINSELANDLGNLLNRCSAIANKHGISIIETPKAWSTKSQILQQECNTMIQESIDLLKQGYINRTINKIWEFINKTNAYFHENEPWAQINKNKQSFEETIYTTIHSLQAIGIMLWPVMPEKMNKLLDSIGFEWQKGENIIEILKQNIWKKPCTIQKIETLFTKYEIIQEDAKQEKPSENKINKEKNMDSKKEENLTKTAEIDFQDFLKVEMKVGTIKECEIVNGSDKLLKLQVDFGQLGIRQILSGIQKYYKPEELIGAQGVFVVNLKPRKMMGMDSQGMMLTAKDSSGNLKILTTIQSITAGATIS